MKNRQSFRVIEPLTSLINITVKSLLRRIDKEIIHFNIRCPHFISLHGLLLVIKGYLLYPLTMIVVLDFFDSPIGKINTKALYPLLKNW